MIKLTIRFLVIYSHFRGLFSFPEGIERCYINDDDCLLKAANKVLKTFSKGIPEIALPSLEPLRLGHMNLMQRNGSMTVDATSSDSHIDGFSNATFVKFKGIDKNFLELEIKAPILTFSGTYKLTAKLLGMAMRGEGHYLNIYKTFDISVKFNLSRVDKEGKKFFKIDNTWMTYDAAEAQINMPDLGHVANWLMNTGFKLILIATRDSISETWSADFEDKLQGVFDKFSIDDMFLK